jgi:hypothetical protein
VIIVLLCLAYIANLRTERKAEALLRDLRTLSINDSTEADVQSIVSRYGGDTGGSAGGVCAQTAINHNVWVTSSGTPVLGVDARPWKRRPFGNQAWGVYAHLATDRGRLCAVLYRIRAYPGAHGMELEAAVDDVRSDSNFALPDMPYEADARIFKNIDSFRTRMSTKATDDQRRRALDFDLSCMARFGGCRAVCELVPSAWLDAQERARQEGVSLPANDEQDPRCPKASKTP